MIKSTWCCGSATVSEFPCTGEKKWDYDIVPDTCTVGMWVFNFKGISFRLLDGAEGLSADRFVLGS